MKNNDFYHLPPKQENLQDFCGIVQEVIDFY